MNGLIIKYLVAAQLHAAEIIPLDPELHSFRNIRRVPLMDGSWLECQSEALFGCLHPNTIMYGSREAVVL